jgi:hypothetical protein
VTLGLMAPTLSPLEPVVTDAYLLLSWIGNGPFSCPLCPL